MSAQRSEHDWPTSECIGFIECRCDRCRADKHRAVAERDASLDDSRD